MRKFSIFKPLIFVAVTRTNKNGREVKVTAFF